jgi:hypothetical protein
LRSASEKGDDKIAFSKSEPEIINEKDSAAFDLAVETNIASRAMRQGGCLYFRAVLDTYFAQHHHHVTA